MVWRKNILFLLMVSVLSINSFGVDMYEDKSGATNYNGRFQNSDIRYQTSFADFGKIVKQYWSTKRQSPKPAQNLPMHILAPEMLQEHEGRGPVLYRLGHSTVLIHIDNQYILTDPVFSQRVSPVQWFGPKRYAEPPIEISSLPQINTVILSHDHYDHLDKNSIMQLAHKVDRFIAPLGVGEHLKKWGVNADKIYEFDWWQSIETDSIKFVATPAQHFSGRGMGDRDSTLWCGWAILAEEARIYFSGDSGYFSGFKEIGERYGPFDVTLLEAGAYNRLWESIHMLPEQTMQAHIDLGGKALLPIHNSTFDLAMHDWFEPLETLLHLSKERNVNLLTPVFGEPVSITQPKESVAWWRELIPENTDRLAFTQSQ